MYVGVQNKKKKTKSRFKRNLIITLILFVVALISIMIYIPRSILKPIKGRKIESEMHAPREYGLTAKEINLNTDDGLNIQSWLIQQSNAKGTVIILSSIEKPSVTEFFGFARMFANRGYNSLLIEMRAHNNSEGKEVTLGMTEWLDVKAGVDYLMSKKRTKEIPIIVMGSSMGGSVALIAAGEIPNIDSVISISPYSSFEDVLGDSLLRIGIPKVLAKMEKYITKLYLGSQYGFSKVKYTPINAIKKLKSKDVLLMYSKEDEQTPLTNYERLMEEAKSKNIKIESYLRDGKEHFVINKGDFSEPENDYEFMEVLFRFLE